MLIYDEKFIFSIYPESGIFRHLHAGHCIIIIVYSRVKYTKLNGLNPVRIYSYTLKLCLHYLKSFCLLAVASFSTFCLFYPFQGQLREIYAISI